MIAACDIFHVVHADHTCLTVAAVAVAFERHMRSRSKQQLNSEAEQGIIDVCPLLRD